MAATAPSPLADRSLNQIATMSAEQSFENSPSSADTSASEHFEPLHQGELPHSDLEYQRQLLQKKLAEKREKFASPTDNVLSPCTAKLQAHKSKKFGKTKPMLLQNRFAQVQQENDSENVKNKDTESVF